MISIKEQVPTVSKAIRLIVAGLREIPNGNFRVNMLTYGSSRHSDKGEEICYGCAATCAIQQLAGKRLDGDSVRDNVTRATALGFDPIELKEFEQMIDQLRQGTLFFSGSSFFQLSITQEHIVRTLLFSFSGLRSKFTEDNLIEFEAIATQLEEKGL